MKTVVLQKRIEFAAVVVLQALEDHPGSYAAFLENDDVHLEPVLDWLNRHGHVEIDEENFYAINTKGRSVLERFSKRFRDFVSTMEVYSAVDLEEGVFAFEQYFEFDNDEDWEEFLEQERWTDLRIAVAEFKNLDTLQIVFMSAVAGGAFDEDQSGWQERLLADEFWDDMLAICENAVSVEDLSSDDLPGEDILRQIIQEGAELNLRLKREEDQRRDSSEGKGDGPEDEYTVEEYTSYVDPYYVSPAWGGFWFF